MKNPLKSSLCLKELQSSFWTLYKKPLLDLGYLISYIMIGFALAQSFPSLGVRLSYSWIPSLLLLVIGVTQYSKMSRNPNLDNLESFLFKVSKVLISAGILGCISSIAQIETGEGLTAVIGALIFSILLMAFLWLIAALLSIGSTMNGSIADIFGVFDRVSFKNTDTRAQDQAWLPALSYQYFFGTISCMRIMACPINLIIIYGFGKLLSVMTHELIVLINLFAYPLLALAFYYSTNMKVKKAYWGCLGALFIIGMVMIVFDLGTMIQLSSEAREFVTLDSPDLFLLYRSIVVQQYGLILLPLVLLWIFIVTMFVAVLFASISVLLDLACLAYYRWLNASKPDGQLFYELSPSQKRI